MVWEPELEAEAEQAEALLEELTYITGAELSIEDIEDLMATAGDLDPEEATELLGL